MSVRLGINLARLYPEMVNPAAPLKVLPPALTAAAVPGPVLCESVRADWGVAMVPRGVRRVPVILFSGGAAADGTGYVALMRHFASHGFAVLHVVHADAYEHHMRRARGRALPARATCVRDVWQLAMGRQAPWEARVRDFTHILDRLPEILDQFELEIEDGQIGAGGYCYGGAAALMIGGAAFWWRGRGHVWRDERVRAVLSLTPDWGPRRPPDRVWRGLTLPVMTITGDGDRDVQGRDWRMKALPFKGAPAGDKYLAKLLGANHFTFSGRLMESAKEPAHVIAQKVQFAAVAGLSLLFWQASLLGDESAKTALASLESSELMGFWRK